MAFLPRLLARLLKFKYASGWQGDGLDRLVVQTVYGNDIAERLKRIHAHAERDSPSGTLIVTLYGRKPAHVRCEFTDGGKMLICDVRIGSDIRTIQGMPIPAEAEVPLRELGYRRDPADGRLLFPYEITTDSALWGGASVVILDPLIKVFGARAGSKIEIVAPLAPFRDEDAIRREMRGV